MTTNTTSQHIKRIIEALLFSSATPLPFSKLREVIESCHPCSPRDLREIIADLQNEYVGQQRAFRLEEIADGYILRSCENYRPYIDLLQHNKRGEKLSPASTEVLAIIAHRQPISRAQIDLLRGVDSSGVVYNLLDRQLIVPVGKLDTPGRPTLYGTSSQFLSYYGLRSLEDLKKELHQG